MIKKILLLAVAMLSSFAAEAQTRDPNNKYLVWTNNVIFTEEKSDSTVTEEESDEDDSAKSFIEKHFRFQSMCDWKEGMRFMVIPDKKDMVIRTFADSTGRLVSSMSLRHKIMVYKGHSGEGLLHERVNFVCEDDGTPYYYELPTANFEDYCYTKFGVPTLAYLGDVDIAIEQLVGKRVLTKNKIYNVDVSTTSYGYEKITIPEEIEVTVVAAGVGTRNYPVKLIVQDDNGREFFQNVAISRTNSGMRDEEFGEENLKHTFEGSFMMLADKMADDKQYKKYIGSHVFTLRDVEMEDGKGEKIKFPRLTNLAIVGATGIGGTTYVKMTFEKDGQKFKKRVNFQRESLVTENDKMEDDYYFHLFASSNTGMIKGVNKNHLADIRKSKVRAGFNETEVKLALGEPDAVRATSKGQYSWVYNSGLSGTTRIVIFNGKTKTVREIK